MRVQKVLAVLLATALAAGTPLLAQSRETTGAKTGAGPDVNQVVDRFIRRENVLIQTMRQYHPMVETYLQSLRSDRELGTVPASDQYSLGRLDLQNGLHERFYTDLKGGWKTLLLEVEDPAHNGGTRFAFSPFGLPPMIYPDPDSQGLGWGNGGIRLDFSPLGFSAMIYPDPRGLDRKNYSFEFLNREFLGDVQCLVFQVTPKEKSGRGRFLGRIWVEDRNFNIVRFRGTYSHPAPGRLYFNMDSWRSNLQPGLWLPSEIYSEETGMPLGRRGAVVQFKAQVRLWGYGQKREGRQSEFTAITVDQASNAVSDESNAAHDWSPVQSLRAWLREAEDNAIEALERTGLVAPPGAVDAVLQAVVQNLETANNLKIQPAIRCRVLLTLPLESFAAGHTIVVSRGLLDVLPDEATLAMVLAPELAHIVRDQQIDTKYAFGDRMSFADQDVYRLFRFERSPVEEREADRIALDILNNSPYKDKLSVAGLFLRQLAQRAPDIPNLTRARLGNGFTDGTTVVRMTELMNRAPELQMRSVDQIAALPLGARIKLDTWNNQVEMMKNKQAPLRSASEKMPFEIAPAGPYLQRFGAVGTATVKSTGN